MVPIFALFFFFFFQAEDGIRDGHVTGVQTCGSSDLLRRVPGRASTVEGTTSSMNCEASSNSVSACSWLPGGISGQRASRSLTVANGNGSTVIFLYLKIGRASCRERV